MATQGLNSSNIWFIRELPTVIVSINAAGANRPVGELMGAIAARLQHSELGA